MATSLGFGLVAAYQRRNSNLGLTGFPYINIADEEDRTDLSTGIDISSPISPKGIVEGRREESREGLIKRDPFTPGSYVCTAACNSMDAARKDARIYAAVSEDGGLTRNGSCKVIHLGLISDSNESIRFRPNMENGGFSESRKTNLTTTTFLSDPPVIQNSSRKRERDCSFVLYTTYSAPPFLSLSLSLCEYDTAL